MSITEIPLVTTYRQVASTASSSEASQILERVKAIRANGVDDASAHNAAIDSAFREELLELIASLDIEHDDFSPVWSLLDAINLLCDNECCESALGFWLVEDLLDSQTIDGCRDVFDYLESRRERMTKVNFGPKHLTILRCCNELLRRLSRAEDTVFCGRVFIYLFQCFPLGDKSSVNLRGEFHSENVTTFDELTPTQDTIDGAMDVDGQEMDDNTAKSIEPSSKLELNTLYPLFWSLQSLFSSPTKLFDPESMQLFKSGIKQTLDCFAQVATATAPTMIQDMDRRGLKRKRGNLAAEPAEPTASTFNPKYLTNRDLFDLEVHDIEFRRHVLVQALILLDFLLSLSVQAKAKLTSILKNKSTMSSLYDKFTLSEDDRAWAVETRKTIEKYLEDGNGTEGRYYLRMVNMVLSRDKNWTFWKAEGCPPISKEAVDTSTELQSEETLAKISRDANAPLTRPKGSLQLEFLAHSEPIEALKAKKPHIPSLQEYYNGITTDDLDLDFATNDEEKKEIEERKAGKLWRALRSARGKRFALCEEIKDGANLDALIGKRSVKEDEAPEEEIPPTKDNKQPDASTEIADAEEEPGPVASDE